MSTYTSKLLISQIITLSEKLGGPFPYEDCRRLLAQFREENTTLGKCGGDLVSDLDAYFYLVESHSSGAAKLTEWPASELSISQALLKKSFFQVHPKYRQVAWLINEINTPRLYAMLTVSDELRVMLQKLVLDLAEETKRANIARQQEFLLT